ncbi:MAG: uroporphyrinogen decarboxylase family protein [Candidatus Binatia bacterium]
MPVTPITQEPQHAETIRAWDAFWSLEDLGRPLWLVPTSPVLTAAVTGLVPIPPLLQDKEVQLNAQLALLGWRETADIGDDFVPHLQPQGGVGVFASAFGCAVDFFEHTLPWVHSVIRESDAPEKVYDLVAPAVDAGQLGDMLAFTDYFVAQTGGRYPVAITDVQGPLDTAYLVWQSSAFMLAMYTNPKEVHHLMRLVTDLIIRYVKAQRARSPEFLPCHYPPLWLPDGRGLAISDDGLAVISPKLYHEFCLPYVNELSEEFGGVMIHSCGNFVHQFDNLERVHHLRGINFGVTETLFEAVWKRFAGKTAIIPHLGLNNEIHFKDNREYMEHVLRKKTHTRGLCIIVTPGKTDMEAGALTGFVEQVKATLAGRGTP